MLQHINCLKRSLILRIDRCRISPCITAVAIASIGVALLSGCSFLRTSAEQHGAAQTTASATTPASPSVIRKPYMGVFEPDELTSFAQVMGFARAVGHRPNIVLYYSGWLQPFETAFAEKARAIGASTLVQIDPDGVDLAAVAAGEYDGYLSAYARAVRTFGHPVIIGFGHEMNGGWYSWGFRQTDPSTWIAAWRHLVTVFRNQGVHNVKWLWTINRLGGKAELPQRWWPGDSYVDWIGIDGYYYLPNNTFNNVFGATIAVIRHITNKPIILSETAIGPIAGQAAKIPGLFAGIKQNHILGLVWFDVGWHKYPGLYRQNWRLEGHPGAIAAFRQGMALLGR